MYETLRGKTIVITGAGRGLGAAFAHVLADLGAALVLAGRTRETLERTCSAIAERTGRVPDAVGLDLADAESVGAACRQILARHPQVDVLVNNGARWLPGRLDAITPQAALDSVNSAITGTLLVTKALAPALLAAEPGGDIVNIVSFSGLTNVPLFDTSVAFYAAKHGQAGLTDGLRQEFRGTPVRVIGLYPPNIEDVSPLDPAWYELPERGKDAGITSRDVVEAALFALTRPRSCTVASILLDADSGGLFR